MWIKKTTLILLKFSVWEILGNWSPRSRNYFHAESGLIKWHREDENISFGPKQRRQPTLHVSRLALIMASSVLQLKPARKHVGIAWYLPARREVPSPRRCLGRLVYPANTPSPAQRNHRGNKRQKIMLTGSLTQSVTRWGASKKIKIKNKPSIRLLATELRLKTGLCLSFREEITCVCGNLIDLEFQ